MNLERAIEIAVEAHKGVSDKGGNPYVLHPLRMMFAVNTEEEKIVAVLHDIVEDKGEEWDFDKLKNEDFSVAVIEALRTVTKITEDEDYDAFIERAMSNPIGRQVKIADLKDNMDVTRIGVLVERDMERLNKYKKALARLTGF